MQTRFFKILKNIEQHFLNIWLCDIRYQINFQCSLRFDGISAWHNKLARGCSLQCWELQNLWIRWDYWVHWRQVDLDVPRRASGQVGWYWGLELAVLIHMCQSIRQSRLENRYFSDSKCFKLLGSSYSALTDVRDYQWWLLEQCSYDFWLDRGLHHYARGPTHVSLW